ncbi:MAG: accessory factor UbiK family protein [Gammaproteobacteria bacterium]
MKCSALENLADKILSALPPGLVALSEDVQDILRDHLKEQLLKLDLIPKEEFDIQCAVLERTQAKLAELERTIFEIEEKIRNQTAD